MSVQLLSGPPSAQLTSDAASLSQLGESPLAQLLAAIRQFIVSENADALKLAMVDCAETHDLPLPLVRSASRGLVSLSSALSNLHSAGTALSHSDLEADLQTLGVGVPARGAISEALLAWHPTPVAPQPAQPVSSRLKDVAKQTPQRRDADHTIADVDVFSANQLVDVSWRFGLTAGNNSVRQVGDSFLQLALQLDRGGSERQTVHVELSLPQFYSFLAELERAAKTIELFS